MSEDVSDAIAAPVPIYIGGKEYKIAQLTDADWAEIERWVQMKYIAVARELAAAMPVEARGDFLLKSTKEIGDIRIDGEECMKTLLSPEGSTRLLWTSIKKNHPEVTLDEIREWEASDGMADALRRVLDAHELVSGEKQSDPQRGESSRSPSPISTDSSPETTAGDQSTSVS